MSQFDKRIQVNRIIENQLPEFVVTDFPDATEFLKQYYISQEFQGGPTDLISNFDQYLKVDNLVPEVVVGKTTISTDISATETTITVPSTKGFPSEYGLLKIDDERISYTGITSTTFTGCIRGFSGITGYNVGISSSLLNINQENLKFSQTSALSHSNGSTLTNLSVLFLQEFFKKLKKTFLPGLENNDFASDLDVGNFIKFSRSFYQSKGVEESVKILFKVLYGVNAKVLDLEGNLIKPSDAEFIRREVVVADVIGSGEPQNLTGQTIFKSTDTSTNASVSEVEVIKRAGKNFYKIALFVGFSDRDLIQGVFTVPGKTKVINGVQAGGTIIDVDSTVGFGTTGTIISGSNTSINYTSKSINQFFGCSGINVDNDNADDVRDDETIFGFENGDLSKRVDLRITGVISDLIPVTDVNLVNEGENIFVKNVGEKIENEKENYKQIFANSWIYNTRSRFQVGISSAEFSLETPIDKAYLKEGDSFEILKRNENTRQGSGDIKTITIPTNSFSAENLTNFTQIPNQLYDIRRSDNKVSSTGVPLKEGNGRIIADTLSVYTDDNDFGYVASNSLPSYPITTDVIEETFSNGSDSTIFDGYDNITEKYSIINFPIKLRDIKFIQGDEIIYETDDVPLSGLETGRTYYVDPVIPGPNSKITKIKLYESISQVGTASTVQVGIGTTTVDTHKFVLKKHASRSLEPDKILRKFPLSQNLFVPSKQETPFNDIGILINGVQIRSPISDNQIFYGPLSSVDLLNDGDGYDILNPPVIEIESSSGIDAKVDPIIQGKVVDCFVDPQDFDISSVSNISLTGGNGSGCVLETVLGTRNRFLEFDSRDIFFNGGVDIVNETITFKTRHNLENGQLVYYNSNGNAPIGIGTAYETTNNITGTLSDGDPYYIRSVNTSTVRLFNTAADALSGTTGINTVGLSTDTAASGIHRFRTENRNTLVAVKVIEQGSGYTYRKLRVKSSGISTSLNTINFKNHGFDSGEIIEYSAETSAIQGLSTTSSYIVRKLTDDSFQLANAGVGGTSTEDYNRGKYVNFDSVGQGFQIFEYPKIKVNINVSYGSTVTGYIVITPVITGKIIGGYLYEEGTNYGSEILDKEVTPKVEIKNGKFAEFKPIIVNGKVESVAVTNRGREYNSTPDIQVISTGKGRGAIVRPVIENGKVVEAIVINTGIGYDSATTEVRGFSRGANGLFGARVRGLTLNNASRFGDSFLSTKNETLRFSILGYSQDIANRFENTFDLLSNGEFDTITGHSPIIGWAYDGNPIYGPFGYSDPNDINSSLKILNSSYILDSNNVKNRPSGYAGGFFVEDYIFNESGDLDIHNGRFGKTPEFQNGVYAYFASVKLGTGTNKLEGIYPYVIGNTY